MAREIKSAVEAEIRRIREGSFDEHAALEAIDVRIREASEADSLLARHIGWLQDVKRKRKQQIAAGEWPKGGQP